MTTASCGGVHGLICMHAMVHMQSSKLGRGDDASACTTMESILFNLFCEMNEINPTDEGTNPSAWTGR